MILRPGWAIGDTVSTVSKMSDYDPKLMMVREPQVQSRKGQPLLGPKATCKKGLRDGSVVKSTRA